MNTHQDYTAVTITIPADGSAHQIYPLVLAAFRALPLPAGCNASDQPSTKCRTITLQNDPDLSTTSVCIGDSNVSSSSMGFKLQVGGSITLQNVHDETLPTNKYWALAITTAVKLNVQFIRG